MKEIKLLAGTNIEKAVYILLDAKLRGESVYASFNGHKLYSDTVTMDSAHMEIIGKTKEEFDKEQEQWRMNYEKEQEELKKKAQEKIPTWIQSGQELIFPELYEEWEKCVYERANDLYNGMEIEASLDIMQALENGITITEAKKMFAGQKHSGISDEIVRKILFTFSSRGPEFWKATARGKISLENKKILKAKENENIQLAQINAQKNDGPKLQKRKKISIL